MSKKNALGRGLGSLIKSTYEPPIVQKENSLEESQVVITNINEVDIEDVIVNPYQPRKVFKEEEISSLAESIKNNQLLNPVVVTKKDDKFVIVSGERRFRAIKSLGWEKLPVSIIEVNDKELSVLALVENVQRVDLNDIEKAYACAELKREFGLTDAELASQLGFSRSAVSNLIRLIVLPSFIKEAIQSGTVTTGQVRPLIGIDLKRQNVVFDRILNENLSARAVEAIVNNFKDSNNKEKKTSKKIVEKDYTNHLKNKIVNKSLKVVKNDNRYEMSIVFEDEAQFKLFLNQYE